MEIQAIYDEHKGNYGYRRVTLELRNRGFTVNHKKVQRLMKILGLSARIRRKRKYSSYQGEILHSDQGSVYTSKAYYQVCVEKGITRSMSRKGTPADNACIEWFHSVLKSETFYLHNWRNLTKDSITDIVNLTSYFIMKLEFNRNHDHPSNGWFVPGL